MTRAAVPACTGTPPLDPAVESAALALVKALAEAGYDDGIDIDLTAVLAPRKGGACRRVLAGIMVVMGDPEEFEDE